MTDTPLPKIQAAFAEQYPRIVREFIESKNLIALTKETVKRSIEGFINGFMAALDFKDKPPFKKYEVKVTFTSDKWNIFEGAKREKIGEITEQSSEEQANGKEQTTEEQVDKVKQELIKALTSN